MNFSRIFGFYLLFPKAPFYLIGLFKLEKSMKFRLTLLGRNHSGPFLPLRAPAQSAAARPVQPLTPRTILTVGSRSKGQLRLPPLSRCRWARAPFFPTTPSSSPFFSAQPPPWPLAELRQTAASNLPRPRKRARTNRRLQPPSPPLSSPLLAPVPPDSPARPNRRCRARAYDLLPRPRPRPI